MRGGVSLLCATALCALAALAPFAQGGSRPAPSTTAGEIGFSGKFKGKRLGSANTITFRISPDGSSIWQAEGDMPAYPGRGGVPRRRAAPS
jgi:hypothetical protein